MVLIGPSLMCADMGNLRDNVNRLEQAGVDYFHFDIMDGKFVPNFTMGPDVIRILRNSTNLPFDIHLMIEKPEDCLELFVESGADMISIHVEATVHLTKTLQKIRDRGLKAGVALNPSTPIANIEYVLDMVDYITVMTVNPGFSGQKFIPLMKKKIKKLKQLIAEENYHVNIQVDGNIGYHTMQEVLENGADMLVLGTSCLFNSTQSLEDAVLQIKRFIHHCQTHMR
ncbi:ribulose-phosphate 3-epimerase [Anoxybacillus sp. B7M1]|jgi:ribulose-phosphate 3-epimerase|uniref:ribulose-phosphate 3-epimerase n=1 Tax=Anoxybacillaceae TaxID=3120669 RepID=UPI0005CD3100|nr:MULTISPECIES: ribulose-phosphate 3-epimerase [Anoxybacillus]ANB57355.1 ribulose-phosphate 3-epimerase [Anoxybacillus sp. B2M1]ANB64741.1 ribulose-phosphate 3-epimerase [Anoxybacillus sp. B7M1]